MCAFRTLQSVTAMKAMCQFLMWALFVKFVVKFVNVLPFIPTVISHFLCVTDTHNRAKSLVLFHQLSLMNFRASHSGITKELVTEASQVFAL